jgi:hypothetical protein
MASNVSKVYVPQIDYVSRDYTAILSDLTAIAKQFNPTWAVTDASDIGVALLETFAYLGDILSFYTDRMASEGFLGTASQRASVLQIAAMLGYTPTPSSAAVVTAAIKNNDLVNPVTIPAGTQLASTTVVNGQNTQIIFETDTALTLSANATGNVTATQGVTVTGESLGTSDGTPSQVFKLVQTGVIINSTGSNISVYVGGIQYTYSSSLVDNGPYDSAFTTTMDADGYTYIVFGDGVGGRIPPATYSVTATYRVGAGSYGNIAAGSLNSSPISGSYNVTISQPSAASGGADDESTDSIRYNVPRALRTLRRAVSLKDYAYLALQVSGISKASADSAVWSSVNLYIAPFGSSAVNATGPYNVVTGASITAADGTAGSGYITYVGTGFGTLTANVSYVTVSGLAPVAYNLYTPTLVTRVAGDGTSFTVATAATSLPTFSASLSVPVITATGAATTAFNTLKSSVVNYFVDKVAPNVTLTVLPPSYVPVNLEMTLRVLPQYSQATVVTQVQSALSNLVSYNNAFFADRIPPHFLLSAITNIDGVDYATIEHLRRNSNEQIFSVTSWVRTVNTATLTIPNTHNITPGQIVRIYNVGSIDGVYGVTSVTGNTLSIAVPLGAVLTTTSPTNAANFVKVISVDSTTSNGVTTSGISCAANEIPTKGTFTITAAGGLS